MNFFKRCWQNHWTRRLVWTAVTLVTLYVLLCASLNWSWGRRWTETAAMLEAGGETLDFRATMNDPVSEGENFCAIPLLKDIALVVDNDSSKGEPAEKRKRLEALRLPEGESGNDRPKFNSQAAGKTTDLKGWAEWLRKEGSLPAPADSGNAARDVLTALAKHDKVVEELAVGLNRTRAQWTPEWKTRELPENLFAIMLPHYQGVRKLNRTLALRGIAAARAGEVVKAHEASQIMARLTQANMNDPFLIGLLVAASDADLLCSNVWEICDAQAGSTEDFVRLEATLARLDFRRSTLRSFRAEMAAAVNTLQTARRNPSAIPGLLQVINNDGKSSGSMLGNTAASAIPLGFFDGSAAALAEAEFKFLIMPLRDQGWQEARKASLQWEKEMLEIKANIWTRPSYIMVSLIAPAMNRIVNSAAYTQVRVDQAVIACALERYRMANGGYPDSLAAVSLANGKPLPIDVMNNKPMGYRKTPDGRYALWSVGFDEKDDGGKRTLNGTKPEVTKFSDSKYLGDWVWDFPEK